MTALKTPAAKAAAAKIASAEELKAKAEEARKARVALLSELTAEHEDNNHFHLRPAMVERWQADRKLKIREKGDVTIITLAGIKAESTAGLQMALNNWAMAARREINELESA
ncbi:MAG: hypothetical protein DI533_04645 [Cereibacter sphaeroides]|uniref:Uncharacterized protein n=1 Tax=Cereibacter sphaeroides TaxID=1063 RepID=A0A2W5U9A8_CERSP|nr:MAG: hypothetical protein DI533_04645 [Cereibacter sphaeroides]